MAKPTQSHQGSVQELEKKLGKKLIGGTQMCIEFICMYDALTRYASQGLPRYKVGKKLYYYNIEECQAWYRGEK